MDVNEELTFLWKLKKNIIFGGRVGLGEGGGGQDRCEQRSEVFFLGGGGDQVGEGLEGWSGWM